MVRFIACTPKSLPETMRVAAAQTAIGINPGNQPRIGHLAQFGFTPTVERIAAVTSKRWPSTGKKFTVGFLDSAPADLRARILSHMNAWSKTANVSFVESRTDPIVRIAFGPDGYWSYLGTDILHIDKNEPTMNLQEFSMATPESEYKRVVRHETGHTLGFPHEHLRKEFVNKIDPDKAIQYFQINDGWSADVTRAQVLTPLEDATLTEAAADAISIMCYQIDGSITKDGKPITGGIDIDKEDYAFARSMYPRPKTSRPSPQLSRAPRKVKKAASRGTKSKGRARYARGPAKGR
jgi:hypothetical protein